MATISKCSLSAKAFFLVTIVIASFMVFSCQETPGEKGEWIPVPPDTSALGKIDHFIPIEDIQRYKDQYGREKDSLAQKLPELNFTTSEAFNKPALLEVLKDPRCVGIRIYYGVNNIDGKKGFRLVIVGVDEQGKDLYITRGSTLANQGDGGKTGGLEYGQCNPPCEP